MKPIWTVDKFGGTSLANAAAYRHVAGIVSADGDRRRAVVVSAMSGVTDALLGLVAQASSRDAAHASGLRELRRRELEAVGDLLTGDPSKSLVRQIEADFNDIEDVLRAIWLMRSEPPHALHLISGYGELWSSRILAAYLASSGIKAGWLDARDVLVVEPGEIHPVVQWDESRRRIDAWAATSTDDVVVIPGFVASDASGLPTTLGRNGSDSSASIFASLLRADSVSIWTDVDGVLSADPRKVPEAVVCNELSYDEAMELAYFGAKVIHPSSLTPAVADDIPIFIRNTFKPANPGTRIHRSAQTDLAVKGFATVDGLCLINLEGSGMIGVPGISERLFGALREAGVSVVLISQGSSEHSICFAVPGIQQAVATEAVESAFFAERHQGRIQKVVATPDCAVLAVVGDNMAGTPGVAAKFFGALGKAAINVRAIAQGSSERNISVVIDGAESTRALRAVHAGFYLSNQTLSIGIVGPGLIGSTLLGQLAGQAERLRSEFKIDLRVRGIISTRGMLLADDRIDLSDWEAGLAVAENPPDMGGFVDHIQTESIPHAVLIDCTASDVVAADYDKWLARGIHVITPNKKANTGDQSSYEALRRSSRTMKMHYLYETTVGAGLPIILTLRDLIQTGDTILRIEGVLSGTLSYLFNSFDGERPFSEIVREAREKGLTEPDPRDDLSGMDVARKVVILAREMGLTLNLGDLEIDSLVPDNLADGSVEDFLENLSEIDEPLQRRLTEARRRGEVLRFVGVVDPAGRSSVRLESYPESHPFARIELTDNIVLFRTGRYDANPLVVQGPGAGPEVTAAGIFADLLRLAAYLGATL